MSVERSQPEPIMFYDSQHQMDILVHARDLVDSYNPRAIIDFAKANPGFDFSHPVAMNDGHVDGTPQFESLAYRCIRMPLADANATLEAAWLSAGTETFKTLVEIGVDPGVRNGQGFSCLDLACMKLGLDGWRRTHKQADAMESFLLDCVVHMLDIGMDIDARTITTPIAQYLSDYSTPREMLAALATGPYDKTRSCAAQRLMSLDVGHASDTGRGGPRF